MARTSSAARCEGSGRPAGASTIQPRPPGPRPPPGSTSRGPRRRRAATRASSVSGRPVASKAGPPRAERPGHLGPRVDQDGVLGPSAFREVLQLAVERLGHRRSRLSWRARRGALQGLGEAVEEPVEPLRQGLVGARPGKGHHEPLAVGELPGEGGTVGRLGWLRHELHGLGVEVSFHHGEEAGEPLGLVVAHRPMRARGAARWPAPFLGRGDLTAQRHAGMLPRRGPCLRGFWDAPGRWFHRPRVRAARPRRRAPRARGQQPRPARPSEPDRGRAHDRRRGDLHRRARGLGAGGPRGQPGPRHRQRRRSNIFNIGAIWASRP